MEILKRLLGLESAEASVDYDVARQSGRRRAQDHKPESGAPIHHNQGQTGKEFTKQPETVTRPKYGAVNRIKKMEEAAGIE